MYKKTISIESQFKKIVDDNPEFKELWATWNLNKTTLEPILNAIIKDYPHYSFHDCSHSESILLNIEKALGNDNIQKLSPTDLWLLLHVAYLHDFGMVILDTKIHEIWTTEDFKFYLKEQQTSNDDDIKRAADLILDFDKAMEQYDTSWPLEIKCAVTLLTSKYCRGQHGDYSRNYILDISDVWGIDLGHNGLIKKRLVSLIADISAIHTKPFEDIYKLHKETNGFKGDYAHPRLVASLLRLGDALDLDNGRFNYFGEKIFGEMPRESKAHYGKHEATNHVLVNEKIIEVEADCPTDAIYRETRKWYDSLKDEVEKMHLCWSEIATEEFSHPPKLVPYKIFRNGKEDSHELSNLKFTINQNKAFEILEGASIYKDKFSCIREIIQNAEDASKIQLWRDIKSGMYYSEEGINKEKVDNKKLLPFDIPEWIYKIYSIQVNVEANIQNNAVVTITDHGTGITLDTLKAICNVGQSFFQKKELRREIEEMPVWLRPTATFGVGLQSCFMATDEFEIRTNSSKDGTYKVIFRTGKEEGYVNVEVLEEQQKRGSSVILEFKNDLNFTYNAWGFTAKHLMNIEPFETNCVIIYKIIESIFQECDSSFFAINVKSESVNFSDAIESNVLKKDGGIKLNRKGDYLYYLDDQNCLTCWYNNNLYAVTLRKRPHGEINVKFKGKEVKKTKISGFNYKGFYIAVDVYGKVTKEALSLNREQLSYKASAEIQEDLKKIIDLYYDLIFAEEYDFKEKQQLVDAAMLTAWYYEKKFPEKLHEVVSKENNVKMLVLNETLSEYRLNECSLHDIVNKYPKVHYINRDIQNNNLIEDHNLSEKELIDTLNQCDFVKEDYPYLIVDNNLKEFLGHTYHDLISLDCDKEIGICIVRDDDELYMPDKYTRKQLIKRLVYRDKGLLLGNSMHIMRRAIPAILDYSKLAVQLKNALFVGTNRESKWQIISPISLKDFEKINEFSEEAFVDFVVTKPVFENIVKYVLDNGRTENTKEDIVAEYKTLIKEFYKVEKGC